MKKSLIFIMAAITKLNKSMVWIIGTVILLMSLLLTVDVILRYFFSAPTSWAFSLATWGTGLLGFALGGYTLVIDQHVRVDLYFEKFSDRTKSVIDMISAFFLFLIAVSLFWLGLDYVIHYYKIGAVMTGGLSMPLWVAWLIVPLGGLLVGLQGLVKFINDLSIIITGKKIYEYEIEEDA